jgi:Ion channel
VHPVFLGLSVVEMNSVERYFLAIQITMMVVYPFLFLNGHPNPFVELPLGLSFLFVGLLTTESDRCSLVPLLSLAGVILLWLGEILHPEIQLLTLTRLGVFVLFLMRAIYVFANRVFFQQGVQNLNRLIGAISIYLQIIALFGYGYMLSGQFDSATVLCGSPLCGNQHELSRDSGLYLYFSTIVMTSVGFGDLIPGTPISGMLASLESMIGQLYVAIVIARLVNARGDSTL